MSSKRGLGRGLKALIKEDAPQPAKEKAHASGVLTVEPGSIKKNPFQPRKNFEREALSELSASIKDRGLLQPILVRKAKKGYELIAGERRLKASVLAGLKEVPVIVMDATDRDSMETSLIENIQREDLNIIEEAEAYKLLADKYSLTQEQIAERVGKARATIANAMRLLDLPREIRSYLLNNDLSTGHAKVLGSLETRSEQLQFARECIERKLSVRELEQLIKKPARQPRKPRAFKPDIPATHLKSISDKLHTFFGTGIRIQPSKTFANGKKGKGSLEIDFYSNEDLDRILELLGLTGD